MFMDTLFWQGIDDAAIPVVRIRGCLPREMPLFAECSAGHRASSRGCLTSPRALIIPLSLAYLPQWISIPSLR